MFRNNKSKYLNVCVILFLFSFLPEVSLAGESEVLYPMRKKFKSELGYTWKQGFMNRQGQVVIEPIFSKVNYFNEGLALVAEEGDWGYIDKKGKVIIKLQYGWATDFSEELAQVSIATEENGEKTTKTTFIDKKSNEAMDEKFDFNSRSESLFKNGIACIAQNRKWGFINKTGEFIIDPIYEVARNFNEGLAPVKTNGKWGFINTEGKFVIEPSFESAFPFREGFAAVQIDGKWGFIDKKGKVIIKPLYDLMEYDKPEFSEGMARICINNKWGFIDEKGKTVIEPTYDYTGNFKGDMAVLKVGGKVGYLSKSGQVIVKPEFISGEDFRQGLAFVMVSQNPDKYAYIDKEGKIVWESD